jgi:hypothetical protein
LPEVESNLKSIFNENYKLLKISKTKFDRITSNNEVYQGVYDSFIHEYFPKEKKSIQIDFIYDRNSDLEVQIEPPSLQPDRLVQKNIPFLPMFCSFDYDFSYTLSFPILVKITDTSVNLGSPFVFYFPMVVNICKDKAHKCPKQIEYDLNLGNLEAISGTKVFNCTGTSPIKDIFVSDNTNLPLNQVDIYYYCEGFVNDCWLGRTSNGKASVALPDCDNPSIELSKQGYGTLKEGVKDSYVLEKIKNFSVEIKLIKVDYFLESYAMTQGFTTSACGKSPEQWLAGSIKTVNQNEKIQLSLGKKLIVYPTTKILDISSGDYNLSAMYISKVKIQPSNYNGTIVGFNKENKYDPYIGEWILGSTSYPVQISSSDLENKNKIAIYVFAEHLSTEDLEVKDFDDSIIQNKRLAGKIKIDETCGGNLVEKDFAIEEKDYFPIIKPYFV